MHSNWSNQKVEQGVMMSLRIKLIAVLMVITMSSTRAQEDPVPVDHSHHSVTAVRKQSDVNSGSKSVAAPPAETVVDMEAMPGMDHSGMNHDGVTSGKADDMSKMNHDGGESLSMQGGWAPPDARDPHAYSEGYDFGPIPRPHMGDEELIGSLLVDRLESATTRGNTAMTYDWQAWFGNTYNRALIRAEGDIEGGTFKDARNELLWAHAITAYWDTQLGIRYDSGKGTDRGWLAFGVQGTAPYWIYVEATAYVNEQGRTSFRLETEYDLLLTQRLILQPRIEVNVYSQRDDTRNVSSGVSDFAGGLRLRYEIWREIAPYVGVEWASKFGSAANNLKAAGEYPQGTLFVAGVRFWF